MTAEPTPIRDGVEVAPLTVHERLGRIVAELPAIGKNQRNQEQGFNFRGIDDVLNALTPLLGQHGVFYVPDVLERLENVRQTRNGANMYVVNLHVRYTFFGPAGDSVTASGWGEGTDMGDKATNKAMTGAMKYVLFQVFAIATAEQSQIDSDRGAPEETVPPPPPAVGPSPEHEALDAFFDRVKQEPPEVVESMRAWWAGFDRSRGAVVALEEGEARLLATTTAPPEPLSDEESAAKRAERAALEAEDRVARDVCVTCDGKFTTSPGSKGLRSETEPTRHADCESF